MTPLHALVLGTVQGLTEFLPVSSSGHLLLVPHLFGWAEQPLAFDVALHTGTLLALLIYFSRDWWALAMGLLSDLRRGGPQATVRSPCGWLALLLAVGTVPAVVAGLAFSEVEDRLRTPGVVAAMLAVVAGAMAAAEWLRGRRGGSDMEQLTLGRAGVVGVAQACALVPGVSRSGSTIAAGMALGLDRPAATRFSFLLALPVTAAAAVKELPALRDAAAQGVSAQELAIGVGTSFLVGMAAIALLVRYLARRPLYPFVWYRLVLAAIVLVVVR